MSNIKNDLILKTIRKEKIERTPVWVMRQAGRYLPEYRAVREKADFLTMCKTPELAAEVTLQPIRLIGVDAAIIFSDILVIPEAMGMNLLMNEGKGPQFTSPVVSKSDIDKLKKIDPYTDLAYAVDAIRVTKKELNNEVPLIGFCGSPWTLMTYMVEGGGSKSFAKIKKFIYNEPKLAHSLLDKLSIACADFLSAQINAGANLVQIFDTWGGLLNKSEFKEFSLNYIEKTISLIKKSEEPVIVFAKGVHHSLKAISKSGANAVGLDWTIDLGKTREKIGYDVALQGNLDPTVLLGPQNIIAKKADEVLENYGKGSGHIFNLGHGILPETPPENLKFLVSHIKTQSKKYHQMKA